MFDAPDSAARAFDILAYGDPNIDLVFATDEVPRADEKALGRRIGAFPGGTVSNFACAASRLGTRVAGFGRVGFHLFFMSPCEPPRAEKADDRRAQRRRRRRVHAKRLLHAHAVPPTRRLGGGGWVGVVMGR